MPRQMEDEATCAVCCLPLGEQPVNTLGRKGSESINRVGVNRGLDISTECGQSIHIHCRRDFIHQRNIKVDANNNNENNNISLRSKSNFDFMTKCLFCGFETKVCNKKRGLDVYPVRTISFQDSVLKVCQTRKDDWRDEILRTPYIWTSIDCK
ncbi:hypothetical protein ACF0H5_008696 [Mactra antiquata]